VIWKTLSCCDAILMLGARLATRSATSRSLEIVAARSVPRTTFSRFTAEINVVRIVSTVIGVLCGTPSIPAGRIVCIWTNTRDVDS